MAGGPIDLHYHVLLLNLEGCVHTKQMMTHKFTASLSLPDGYLNICCLKIKFLFSACAAWSSAACRQDYLTAGCVASQGLAHIFYLSADGGLTVP